MRSLLLCLLLWCGPLAAQDRTAIETVISRQMEAFTARDEAAAFDFASPLIQRLFQTPEGFSAMVRQGYPMVWDNRDVRFLELREIEGFWWQKVLVRGPDGAAYVLDYQMVELADGWRINAVTLLPSPDLSV